MATVKQNQPASLAITLFNSTDGSPLTGVTAPDVTLYFRRPDLSTPVEKDITTSNFRELDAVNMPGVYEVDFTAEDTNRSGEFFVTIQANGAINLEQKNFSFDVVREDAEPDDLNNTSISILDQNSSPTVMFELRDGDGDQVQGLTQDYVEPVFFKNGTEDTTNTTFSSWAEVDDVFYPGLYRAQLPTGATDTLGDLIMRVQKNWDYDANTLTSNVGDSGNVAGSFDDGTRKLALFGTGDNLYENTTFSETSAGSWSIDLDWNTARTPLGVDIFWDAGNSELVKAVSDTIGDLHVYKSGTYTEYYVGTSIRLSYPVIFGPNLITVVDIDADERIYKYDGTSISLYHTGSTTASYASAAQVNGELWLGGSDGLYRIVDPSVLTPTRENISARLPGHAGETINDLIQRPSNGDVLVISSNTVWYSTDSGASFDVVDLPSIKSPFSGVVDPENDTFLSAVTYDAYDPEEPFVVGAAFDLLVNREVAGSQGTDWDQVTFEGQGYGTASDLGFAKHRFIGGSVDTVDEDNFEAGIWYYRDIPFFYPPFLRFSVRREFTDISTILTELGNIKGSAFDTNTDALDNLYDELTAIQGSGFVPSEDSLRDINTSVNSNSTSLGSLDTKINTVRAGVSAIQGSNFIESIHSLSAKYEETPYVGQIEQSTSATITIKVGERTGIGAADLEADLVKGGTVATTSLLSSWQEIDSVNLPGVYRFTLSNTDTDTLGDLLVRIEQITGTSTEFVGVQFLSPSSADINFQGSPVDVTAFGVDRVAVLTDGSGGIARDVAFTMDGGSTWDNVSFFGTGTPGRRITHRDRLVAGPPRAAVLYGSLTLATGTLSPFSDLTDVTLTSTIQPHPFADDIVIGSGLSMVADSSDLDVAWMATGDGEGNSPPTGHVVRYSDNAGSDSVVRDGTGVGPNGQVYMDVYALDDQTAIVLAMEWQTADMSTPYPRIYKTTDAGVSWTEVYSAASVGAPAQVEFDSTGQYGFATVTLNIGTSEIGLYRTTDGGDSWTAISPTVDGSSIVNKSAHRGLQVIDQDNVVIGLSGGSEEFYLFQSKDGGQTFTKVDVSDDITSGVLYGIDGFSNQTFGAVDASSPASQDVVQYGHNPFPPLLKDLSYKFRVVGETSVDLSPVITDLNEIKGTGFDTNTDSLEQIRDASGSTDLTPVTDALDEIKGAGFTESTDSLEALANSSASVETALNKTLGLSQENYRIVNQTYNADNQLTSATIRIYGNAADADNDTNPIAEYSLSSQYNSQGQLVDYLVVEV